MIENIPNNLLNIISNGESSTANNCKQLQTAKIAKEKFKKVVELTKKIENQIMKLTVKPENAKRVIDFFYDDPVASRKKIIDNLNMPPSTLNGVISELQRIGILEEATGYARNQLFVFKEYVDIFLN